MSRKLRKCWICDKCGETVVDEYSSFEDGYELPRGWIFVGKGTFSNKCLCARCVRRVVQESREVSE